MISAVASSFKNMSSLKTLIKDVGSGRRSRLLDVCTVVVMLFDDKSSLIARLYPEIFSLDRISSSSYLFFAYTKNSSLLSSGAGFLLIEAGAFSLTAEGSRVTLKEIKDPYFSSSLVSLIPLLNQENKKASNLSRNIPASPPVRPSTVGTEIKKEIKNVSQGLINQ